MSLCNIVNSVNKIKRLFRKYGASNVNETFLFNVSILLLLLLFEHSVCAVYFTCICFNFLFLRFAELNAPEETGKETDFVLI